MAYQVKSFKDMKMTIQIGPHHPLERNEEQCEQKKRKRKHLRICSGMFPQTTESSTVICGSCSPTLTGCVLEKQDGQPVVIKQELVWDDSLLSSTGFSFCTFSTDHLLTETRLTGAGDECLDPNASTVTMKREPDLNVALSNVPELAVVSRATPEVQTCNTFGQCSARIKTEPRDSSVFGMHTAAVSSNEGFMRAQHPLESEVVSNVVNSKPAENAVLPDRETRVQGRPNSVPETSNQNNRHPEDDARQHENSATDMRFARLPPQSALTPSPAHQVSANTCVVKQEVVDQPNGANPHGVNGKSHLSERHWQDQFFQYLEESHHLPATVGSQPDVGVKATSHNSNMNVKASNHNMNTDLGVGDSHVDMCGSGPRRSKEEERCHPLVTGANKCSRPKDTLEEGAWDVHTEQLTQTDMQKTRRLRIPVFRIRAGRPREASQSCHPQKPPSSSRPAVSLQNWVPPAASSMTSGLHNPSGRNPSSEQVVHFPNASALPNKSFYCVGDRPARSVFMVHHPSTSFTTQTSNSGVHQPVYFFPSHPDLHKTSARFDVQNPQGGVNNPMLNLQNFLPNISNLTTHFQPSSFGVSRPSTYSGNTAFRNVATANLQNKSVPVTSVNGQNQCSLVNRLSNTTFPNPPDGAVENLSLGFSHRLDSLQNAASAVPREPKHVCGVCRMLFSTRVQCILHINQIHRQGVGSNPTQLKDTVPVNMVDHPPQAQRLALQGQPVAVGHGDGFQGHLSSTQRVGTQDRPRTELTRAGTLNLLLTNAQKEPVSQAWSQPSGVLQTRTQPSGANIDTTEKRTRARPSHFSIHNQTGAPPQKTLPTVVCSLCSRHFSDDPKYSKHLQATLKRTGWYYCRSCKKFITDVEQHLTVDDTPHQIQKVKHLCPGCGQSFTSIIARRGYAPAQHSENKAIRCSECGKAFSSIYRLAVHQKVHSLSKEHKCNVCGDLFRRQDYLTLHMRKHTGNCIP